MISLRHRHITRNDTEGMGRYGAPRGSRTHNGIDLLAIPDQPVYADTDMEFVKVRYPDGSNLNKMGGLYKVGEYMLTVYYMNPTGKKVIKKGDQIGIVQDVAAFYNTELMMPHIHVEIEKDGDVIDPTDFVL